MAHYAEVQNISRPFKTKSASQIYNTANILQHLLAYFLQY